VASGSSREIKAVLEQRPLYQIPWPLQHGRRLGASSTTSENIGNIAESTQNDWRPPTELPDLRRVDFIALDTETRDDGLRADRGSAWPWRGGHVCGVSVAWRADGEIRAIYVPMRHPDSENVPRENVIRWLKDLLASDVRIVTQNGLYDYGWLRSDFGLHMPPAERLEEILALATLIDENRFSYSLDSLCTWRGLPGKDETLLRQAVEAAGFKISKKTPLQSYIHKLPARFVGPYAEIDAANPLALFENLNPILDKEGTRAAYRLEVDLLPMVHEMRRRGIRVDQSAAEQGLDYCLQKRDAALVELSEKLGANISMSELASPKWKTRTFDAHKINYPRTEKGNPSFKAGKTGWMALHSHWLPRLIAVLNKYNFAGSTFLQVHILEHLIGDRIYGEINPFRSEEGGTKSFRFSYSDPPLQQMPSRDKELGPLVRRVFQPEEAEFWCTADISQQEFRHVVHRAFIRDLSGAAAARERYLTDPDTDFHALTGEITGLPRDDAKAVNFAKIYGAGEKKFAEMIGKRLSEAQSINAQYDIRLPFVWQLSRKVQEEAVRLGYTVLYDGARRHWDRWAPRDYSKGAGPCSLAEAQQRIRDPKHPWFYQQLQRVGIHTALNAQIQGDAARHTKLWMRAVWREGIVPLLQMHDALELSVTTREQGELVARLACEAVKLEVPMRADIKYGRNWGDATHTWDDVTHTWDARGNGNVGVHEREDVKMSAAERIAKALGGHKNGSGWVARCPVHDDQKPSLSIGSGKDGKVLVHCHAGCNQRDVFNAILRKRGLLGQTRSHKREDRTADEEDADADARKRSAFALTIWRACGSAHATLVQTYLAARGIALPVPDALRFHRGLKHPTGDCWPAMVALVTNGVDATPLAIHRTFLARDGSGKAPVDPQKMMLGPCRGGVVRLADAGNSDVLMVGEGIETCLAAMQATGHPTWAALSTSGLRALELPEDVRDVVVLADGDAGGEAAARDCAWRWKRQNRRVRIARPPQGMDFNDMLMRREGVGQ
jgi:DNA polymerase I-like protein with 3'-5' exonuclease and polymerase domains